MKELEKLLNPQLIVFSSQHEEEEIFHENDLVELHPYGLSVGQDGIRPFLILKDSNFELSLPVAINPIEAGMAINQSGRTSTEVSPHRFLQGLVQSLGIELLRCVFVEIKGVNQYVRIYFSGHASLNSIKLKADEAMSVCIFFKLPIFATKSFIGKSKIMSVEVENTIQKALAVPEVFNRNGQYLN